MTLVDELEQLAKESWMRETWYEVYDPDAFNSMITCDGDTGPLAFSVPQPAAKAIVILVNNLPAIIAALRAQEWQPIETAPRDGTRFLGMFQNAEISRVTWWSSRQAAQHGNGWVFSQNGLTTPTHWRPLPTPPAHDKGEPK